MGDAPGIDYGDRAAHPGAYRPPRPSLEPRPCPPRAGTALSPRRRMTRLTVLTYLLTSLGGQRGARDDTGRLRTVRTFLAPLTGARRLSKRKTKSTGASRVRRAPLRRACRRRSHMPTLRAASRAARPDGGVAHARLLFFFIHDQIASHLLSSTLHGIGVQCMRRCVKYR